MVNELIAKLYRHIHTPKLSNVEKNIDKINIKKALGLITFQPKLSNSVNQ
jgi:hypothetical protein